MEDKVSYMIDKDEINQQKMQLVVINRRPQYLQKPQEVAKREIARQLFQIFRNMNDVIEGLSVQCYNISVGGLCHNVLFGGNEHDV